MSVNNPRNNGRRRGDDVHDLLAWHPWLSLCTLVVHRDGIFLWGSAKALEMLGDIVGRPIHEFVAREYHTLMDLTLGRVWETGEPGPPSEIKYISSRGTPVFARVQSYRIIWQGVPALLTAGNDNTTAWRAAAALYNVLSLYLSPRALEFINLRAHGVEYTEIAQIWGVDRYAVRNYPAKIMKRLKTDRAGYDEMMAFVSLYFFYENL